MTDKNYNIIDILSYLWKNKKPIIIVTIIGAISSIIASLLLQNYYKATTILFPTTFVSSSTSLLKLSTFDKTDHAVIGDGDDLERMIQILKSTYIFDKIVDKYNLTTHYGLKTDDPHINYNLNKIYYSSITFKKTPYQSVIISVIDTDPKFASDIANDIAGLFDSIVFDMQLERNKQAYLFAKNAYFDELAHIKKIEDTLNICKKNGVFFYEFEIDRYSQAYASAIAENKLNSKTKKKFDDKFDKFKKYGQISQTYTLYLEEAVKILSELHKNLVQAKQNLKTPITHKYTISYAKKPDKKDYPKRTFIVIFSTIGAFIFSIVIILFLDFYRKFRKHIK